MKQKNKGAEGTGGIKMLKGTVKWYNNEKKYGFIAGEDGQDYFVHVKALVNLTTLNEGDNVSFEPVTTERGKQAQYVELSV